jgi:hypothetical protein
VAAVEPLEVGDPQHQLGDTRGPGIELDTLELGRRDALVGQVEGRKSFPEILQALEHFAFEPLLPFASPLACPLALPFLASPDLPFAGWAGVAGVAFSAGVAGVAFCACATALSAEPANAVATRIAISFLISFPHWWLKYVLAADMSR